MKKTIFSMLAIMLSVIPFCKANAAGADYEAYPELYFVNNKDCKLLYQFSEDELDEYYDKLPGNIFSGWNVYEFQTNEKVNYTAGTVYMYRNEGNSESVHELAYKEEEITKRNFSVTGNLNVTVSGNIKKLKAGLDEKLKIEYSESDTLTTRTNWSIKTYVDPNTLFEIKIKGEGTISTGVAEKYFFWIRTHKGAYEIFNVSTEYYCMEKTRL